jgi:hypothetical protein
MGTRGPIPKREDQRVRRNKPEVETTTVIPVDFRQINQPMLGLDDPDQMVVDFYYSLGESAQAQFYEPSDWQYARWMMRELDHGLKHGMSAVKFQAITSALSNLLITEGDRRRVRLEVERKKDDTEKGADITALYRERLRQM